VTETGSDRRVRRLLVVDDEAVPRLLVTGVAETLGFAADGAATLAEAVERVHAATHDVVVLDLGLREHDGIELLRTLAKAGSDPVLIFVSGFDERVRQAAARLAAALGLRVAGTLSKPLPVQRLIALLRSMPERATPGQCHETAEIDPAELAKAIERDEIECRFQPKVALATRKVLGLEMLARWRSPRLGLVSPDRFIPVAEASGLIDRLTYRILARALDAFRPWRRDHPELSLAVNLSPVSLTDLTLPERVSEALARADIPPAALVLEITEGAVMSDYVAAADILTRLRIRGVRVSIDDFGTGHASLLSLLRLPFSELKIDQSFVHTCLDDPEAPKIVSAIVSLADKLGLQLVAEGIETEAMAELMSRLGCPVGQGFLFAEPLTEAATATLLSAAVTGERGESALPALVHASPDTGCQGQPVWTSTQPPSAAREARAASTKASPAMPSAAVGKSSASGSAGRPVSREAIASAASR
jgi:EAL domain-containing protein (putative c-di-GMP-specific phosphodiesterase class I)